MKKKIIGLGVLVLTVILVLFIIVRAAITETTKVVNAWPEMMFAKDHASLVEPVRGQYAEGLRALEETVIKRGTMLSPLPDPTLTPTPTEKVSN